MLTHLVRNLNSVFFTTNLLSLVHAHVSVFVNETYTYIGLLGTSSPLGARRHPVHADTLCWTREGPDIRAARSVDGAAARRALCGSRPSRTRRGGRGLLMFMAF